MAKRPETANVQLKLRCKEPLRARLEKAAARRGVSMNEEMISRLEGSFETDARFGAQHVRKITETVASLVQSIEGWTGKACTRDLETRRRVRDACIRYFEKAVGDDEAWSDATAKDAAGKAIARGVLKDLCDLPERRINAAFKILEDKK